MNSRRRLQRGNEDLSQQYSFSGYGNPDRHQVSKLDFKMWVSLPDKIDKMEEALHNYTRLQSNCSTTEPTMLENIKNWRSMYPRLGEIVNNWTPSERCDVIMLDASFQLMGEFPPRGSKLGISLELDFLDPLSSNYKSLQDLHVWEQATTIYHHGCKFKEEWYEKCHTVRTGQVKPPFESKYWADRFTDLTDRKLRAEDSKNEAAIEAANERSRSYLRHLTVIQEIYGSQSGSPVMPRKRMAILLWKFSQAQRGWAGITTWQRLIPPPDRMATNSPPPTQEMALPPLAMDTVMDMAMNGTNLDQYDFLGHFDPQQAYASFSHDFDQELCQDGTMMPKYSPGTANQLAEMQASFALDSVQVTSSQDMHNMQPYQFELPLHPHYLDGHGVQAPSSNFSEAQHHHESQVSRDEEHEQHEQSHGYVENEYDDEPPNSAQHPLNLFDVNTHKMLQEQLGQNDENSNNANGIDDEALRQALVAASAMNDLGSQPLATEHHQNSNNSLQHRWTAPPTPLTRPQLQIRAGFIGHASHHSPRERYEPLHEISHNMLTANQMVRDTPHSAPMATEQDQYQSMGNTQMLGSFHLDNSQSQLPHGM